MIEDGFVCYFRHYLQTADSKQAAIDPVLDANTICSRDFVTKDESHWHKEEVEKSFHGDLVSCQP